MKSYKTYKPGLSALIFLLLWMGSVTTPLHARQEGKAYPGGIYLFCGEELPKKFSYLIEKQTPAGEWISVAELKAPAGLEECNARIRTLPEEVAAVTEINSSVIEFAWSNLRGTMATLDSIYAYSDDPRFQYVAGVGWFDSEVNKRGSYKYRISRLSPTGVKSMEKEVTVNWPAPVMQAKATPLRYKLNPSSVGISYDVSRLKDVTGLKLFRSSYLQNNFIEIVPETHYTTENEDVVAILEDKDVISGLTYSYYAVPHDGLGNLGQASDTINIYFLSKQADMGLITYINAIPQPDNAGNLISWNYNPAVFVQTVELYRSISYDGSYMKIASLPPNQKSYFDNRDIEPSFAYFYYIVLNNGMGGSLPSPRVPAILEGKKENLIPPQDLQLTKNGNIVTLSFRRVGHDIHGYYVYRADGYTAPVEQLPNMLLSADSLLIYNDTLPLSARSEVYSYTVASVNSSYNISPMSERVNVSFSGGQLPAPAILNAAYKEQEVQIFWSDAAGLNTAIVGYELFRAVRNDLDETEAEELIATTDFENNYFTDREVKPGETYVYRVRSITNDASDASSHSLPYSVFIPVDAPMQPAQVSAFAAAGKISIKWVLPVSDEIESVQILRAAENERAVLLTTLDASAESYDDSKAKKGVMYYYFIVLKYKNGSESKPTDAVSAKLR